MAERIFTIDTNEVPKSWQGRTFPITMPDNAAGLIATYGDDAVYTFAFRAIILDKQKRLKDWINKHPDATTEEARAFVATLDETIKTSTPKLRDPNAEPKSASSGVVKEAKAAMSEFEATLREMPELITKRWDRLPDSLKIRLAADLPQYVPAGAAIPTPKPAPAPKTEPTPAPAANGATEPAAPVGNESPAVRATGASKTARPAGHGSR